MPNNRNKSDLLKNIESAMIELGDVPSSSKPSQNTALDAFMVDKEEDETDEDSDSEDNPQGEEYSNPKEQSNEELDIGESIKQASNKILQDEKIRKDVVDKRWAKKRQENNVARKKAGLRPGKQSKYPTRSDDFLQPKMRSLHILLYQKEVEIYKDGADFSPRTVIGIPAYGHSCKKNAFERLVDVQEKIREKIGVNNANAPRWIIISNDSSMIMDRNILQRLEELKPHTHCAGAYGFEGVGLSQKWFQVNSQSEVKGMYVQGSLESADWDFIVGDKFKDLPKWRISMVHGPMIAVRGETFMDMDFKQFSEKMRGGFHHYMAEISLECVRRGKMVATIKTITKQFDRVQNYFSDEGYIHDHALFSEKWKSFLPVSIRDVREQH